MSKFWIVFASIFLSLAWLLPNHSLPWMSFHGDAWAASMLLLVASFVLWRNRFCVAWHWLTAVSAGMALIPLIQYAVGMTPLFGVAWINSVYLLGLLTALLAGAAWELESPGQCADYLFLAIGIAAVVSVGLQLNQFFDLEPFGPWTLQSTGTRHFANIAQPNQMASLLLLGVLGCAWGFYRKYLGATAAFVTAALLLLGVVLTESRTAWLNVILLLGITVYGRRYAPDRKYLGAVVGLGCYFLVCILMLPTLNDFFGGGLPVEYRSPSSDTRWAAWGMFLKAILHRPLFGFGWGQLGHAQFLMLDEGISLGGSLLQAHNLILDLVLWNGIPLGLSLAAFLGWWCWTVVRGLRNFSQLLLISFLVVLGTHAMLEYPLQYAYFLLPAGMVMGCLNVSLGLRTAFGPRKWLTGVVLLLAMATLVVTIRDYFRIETSFYGLRFELKKIDVPIPRTPPDVLALTQWRDHIVFSRMELRSGIAAGELAWMRNMVSSVPSPFVLYRFAAMLAMNDQPAEAQQWLRRTCQISSKSLCEIIEAEWAKQSLIYERIAAVPWPGK